MPRARPVPRSPHADVLLATANFMALDPKQARKRRPYPPLATLLAASRLRADGHRVALFDAMLADDESAFEAVLAAGPPAVVALYEDSFNFLSKMCLERMRQAALRMTRAAREAGALVIAAGPDVTDRPALYLDAGASAAIAGEADHALAEAMAALQGGGGLGAVPGLVLSGATAAVGLHRTAPREPERRPDVFPPVAWDLIDVEAYRRVWLQAHGRFSISLVTTRGCPFHCNWCAKPIWGQRYAMHSPARAAEDVALAKSVVGPDHIWFADDIFGLRPDWLAAFAVEVARRDARVPFTIQSRADLMTDAAVSALAAAGCEEVWIGAESGSQRVLDAMDKGLTVHQIGEARERLGRAGIRACFFLQFGYPGETFEDVLLTAAMVRTLAPDDIGVSVSYPLPGTVFHQRVAEQLGAKTNWMDSDDLAMMFRGSFDSAFYRHLHEVMHRDLDLQRVLARAGTSPATDRAREDLDRAWEDLRRLAAARRQPSTTRLPPSAPPPRPDLSRDWN